VRPHRQRKPLKNLPRQQTRMIRMQSSRLRRYRQE
jgi:hypothetical protein